MKKKTAMSPFEKFAADAEAELKRLGYGAEFNFDLVTQLTSAYVTLELSLPIRLTYGAITLKDSGKAMARLIDSRFRNDLRVLLERKTMNPEKEFKANRRKAAHRGRARH